MGYEFLLNIAQKRLDNQIIHEGDYYLGGMLMCGTCGKPRQKMMVLDDGTEYKSVCQCDCELRSVMAWDEGVKEAEARYRKDERRSRSMMDTIYYNARFSNCTITDENRKNIEICKKYVERFADMLRKNQGLMMWGDVGTGKSYAAACIANELIDQGYYVVMTSFVQFLEIIQKDYSEESALMDRIMDASLLIIDDLGAERHTDYALEKVYNVIDSRYRRKLPMILTTNMIFDDMVKEDDIRYRRIYDRIFEGCYPMHFKGKSFRRMEANKRFVEMKRMLE